jgi:hypothetical protein
MMGAIYLVTVAQVVARGKLGEFSNSAGPSQPGRTHLRHRAV